jgi:hypothetical protein
MGSEDEGGLDAPDGTEQVTLGQPEGEQPAEDEGDPVAEIARLFEEDEEQQPPWFRALDAMAKREGVTSFKGIKLDEIKDSASQQTLFNVRNLLLRSNDAVQRERQALQERAGRLTAAEAEVKARQGKLLEVYKDPRLAGMFKEPEGEAPDPFTEEGIRYRVDQGVAKVMQQFFAQMGTIHEEGGKAAVAERERVETEQRRSAVKEFVKATPDFWDHADAVEALVKQGIPVDRAYRIAKAEAGQPVAPPKPAAPKDEAAARRAARMSGAEVIRRGGASEKLPTPPKDCSPEELVAFYRANPEVMDQDLAPMKRGRFSLA